MNLLLPKPKQMMDCKSLEDSKEHIYIATGWTKVSYSAKLYDKDIAIKTVNVYGRDVRECLKWDSNMRLLDCYQLAAAKILREIFLLQKLIHPNVIEMLGYCVPVIDYNGAQSSSVSVITELGQPIDIISLLQMSWEDRLRVSLGMAHLLYHLAHSSLGSLLMSDFRRQQFVLVRGKLKLSDVDDIIIGDPKCSSKKNCTSYFPQQNLTLSVPCQKGICSGLNEKQNIIHAGRHFMSFILPHGVPGKLQPFVDKIVDAYSKGSWDSEKLLQKTEEVVYLFINGFYRNTLSEKNALKNYRIYNDSDLPGLFDYHCQLTLSGHGCTLSVFDTEEAAKICSGDPECKAFVLTNDTTWSGRKIVHFKNGYKTPVKSITTLFVKN
ncbi:extracellular tyrosine-protein kinase PKDCC-like [Centruroides vittatus]|uniref:extracellular tyrosine-protein kinase PKDCC-like n=1 Tax=Centruroides vittatus TaxID=120091 RepID=UPI00350EA766